jgi:hypothetical protein
MSKHEGMKNYGMTSDDDIAASLTWRQILNPARTLSPRLNESHLFAHLTSYSLHRNFSLSSLYL